VLTSLHSETRGERFSTLVATGGGNFSLDSRENSNPLESIEEQKIKQNVVLSLTCLVSYWQMFCCSCL